MHGGSLHERECPSLCGRVRACRHPPHVHASSTARTSGSSEVWNQSAAWMHCTCHPVACHTYPCNSWNCATHNRGECSTSRCRRPTCPEDTVLPLVPRQMSVSHPNPFSFVCLCPALHDAFDICISDVFAPQVGRARQGHQALQPGHAVRRHVSPCATRVYCPLQVCVCCSHPVCHLHACRPHDIHIYTHRSQHTGGVCHGRLHNRTGRVHAWALQLYHSGPIMLLIRVYLCIHIYIYIYMYMYAYIFIYTVM